MVVVKKHFCEFMGAVPVVPPAKESAQGLACRDLRRECSNLADHVLSDAYSPCSLLSSIKLKSWCGSACPTTRKLETGSRRWPMSRFQVAHATSNPKGDDVA